ncbi:hypothetical protein PGT21_024841 [Puccinia graminis f. sp. tritici]|uniref:Uncharacterized protein n=1 Tax=Puccinia graminis f. sp. tritici TaxID=56615 RepID=A0A5B0N2L7_PUCGR|nr:hypothetical protein PGT21_024841 [Puccinia graminis f. sp. tritici]KAA1123974.1 hypothetical protein PGTUg99_014876 [Puccinia graminis f. sp. tritici]
MHTASTRQESQQHVATPHHVATILNQLLEIKHHNNPQLERAYTRIPMILSRRRGDRKLAMFIASAKFGQGKLPPQTGSELE